MSAISPIYVLKRTGEAISSLHYWNYGSHSLLVAAYGGKAGVDVWNLKTHRISFKLPSLNPVLSAHGTSSGYVVTLDKEGYLRLIDITHVNPFCKTRLIIPEVAFCKAAVLNENDLIVAVPGENKSSINVWDISKETIIARLIPSSKYNLGMPWCIKLLGKDQINAMVGYEDGSIICWDVFKKELKCIAENLYSDPIMCFDAFELDCEGIFGICGSVDECLIKFKFSYSQSSGISSDQLTEKISVSILQKHKIINKGFSSIKIRPDHKIVVTGGWDAKIRLFSWKCLKPLAVLNYHTGPVQSIAFSSDKQFACGSTDNKISVWNIYSEK